MLLHPTDCPMFHYLHANTHVEVIIFYFKHYNVNVEAFPQNVMNFINYLIQRHYV